MDANESAAPDAGASSSAGLCRRGAADAGAPSSACLCRRGAADAGAPSSACLCRRGASVRVITGLVVGGSVCLVLLGVAAVLGVAATTGVLFSTDSPVPEIPEQRTNTTHQTQTLTDLLNSTWMATSPTTSPTTSPHATPTTETQPPTTDLPVMSTENIVTCETLGAENMTSCAAIQTEHPGAQTGVYTIFPGCRAPGVMVRCDMDTDGGGWTVFQHRLNGSVDFFRTWADYKHGFGSADSEYWLGNDAVRRITKAQPCMLRVDLWDWTDDHRYATYKTFAIGKEVDKYALQIAQYNGTAGDSLTYSDTGKFSAKDQDNDNDHDFCAAAYAGGWWYRQCYYANLNGRYDRHGEYSGGYYDGVVWYHWRNSFWYSLKAVTMMVRPHG